MKVDLKFVVNKDSGYIRMAYRRFDLNAGEVHTGHTHDIDHATILWSGSVKIKYQWPYTGEVEKIFKAPSHFYVRKDVEHEITALEDGTSWACVFLPPEGYEEDLKPFWNETFLYPD